MSDWRLLVRTHNGTVSLIRDLTMQDAINLRRRLLDSSKDLISTEGVSNKPGSAIQSVDADGKPCLRFFAKGSDVLSAEPIPPGAGE